MSALSDEQRRRLEANRKKALAIRASKQQQHQHKPQCRNVQPQVLLQKQNTPPQSSNSRPQLQELSFQSRGQTLQPPTTHQTPKASGHNFHQPAKNIQLGLQLNPLQSPPSKGFPIRTNALGPTVPSAVSKPTTGTILKPPMKVGPNATIPVSFTVPQPPIPQRVASTPLNTSDTAQSDKNMPNATFSVPTAKTSSSSTSFYKDAGLAPPTEKKSSAYGGSGSWSQRQDRYGQSGVGRVKKQNYEPGKLGDLVTKPSPLCLGQTIMKATCVLVSRTRFEVQVGFMNGLIEVFKTMQTKQYNPQNKCWSFELREYEKLKKAIATALPGIIQLEELSHPVLHTFKEKIKGKVEESDSRHVPTADLSNVDNKLVQALLPFQRQGVDFAIWKNGRLLLADDMGLGKTIQAICLACYYRHKWPLLIVVPSSVRFAWREQFLNWLPSVDPQEIHVITSAKDRITACQVTIVSYDLLVRSKVLQAKLFNVIIMDECHLLKNSKTARTKAALPLLKKSAHVILLSGTPALSRPSELFTQISAVDQRTFPNFHNYGLRYCEGKQHQWGWDYSGSSHMEELQIVLQENIMIRRLKKDVMSQLPSKRREMIVLNPSSVKANKIMKSQHQQVDKLKGKERRGALLEYFHETGSCKGPAVREYVLDLLESDHKFLFFGHHQEMLDCVEEGVRKNKYKFIRIDGRTSSDHRNQLVEDFQHNDDIKIAILSIMAANAGINLTAATLVVFGELFWNPGILVQAEDRVHRIGQENSVSIRYLVATGTADDYVWPLVQQKLNVLGKAGLSKDDFSSANTQYMKDPNQMDMMMFLEQSFLGDDWEDNMAGREEFVENPSPKKKTPKKQAWPTTPSKYKQRTIFKYLSPSKRGLPLECDSPSKAPTTSSDSCHSSGDGVGGGHTVTGSLQSGLNSMKDQGVSMSEESIKWDEDIPECLLQDVDFDEPPPAKTRVMDM